MNKEILDEIKQEVLEQYGFYVTNIKRGKAPQYSGTFTDYLEVWFFNPTTCRPTAFRLNDQPLTTKLVGSQIIANLNKESTVDVSFYHDLAFCAEVNRLLFIDSGKDSEVVGYKLYFVKSDGDYFVIYCTSQSHSIYVKVLRGNPKPITADIIVDEILTKRGYTYE